MIDNQYSVLMSIYLNDSLRDIQRSIESINNQEMPTNDFVIVLDGPVREEVSVFFEKPESDFNVIRLPSNRGLGAALSVGLPKCRNNWVLRMDADDVCPPDRSKKLFVNLGLLEAKNIAAVGSFILERNRQNSQTALLRYPEIFRSIGRTNYFRDPIGHASALLNKTAVEAVGGYQTCLYFEDTYLWLRLLKNGYCLATVPDVLYEASVSNEFYARRSGFKYAKIEVINFWKFYCEGLITLRSFLVNVLMRPVIRLLPRSFVKKFYLKFLRKENGYPDEYET